MGQYSTTTKYLLEALIRDGSKNTLSRKQLLVDISSAQRVTKEAVRAAFSRLLKQGLLVLDDEDIPRLTSKGLQRTRPFIAKKLPVSYLMVIFDIAESKKEKRNHLRRLLKELSFKQVQKSVWVSEMDHRVYLKAEIAALKLKDKVLLFESHPLQ